MAAKFERVDRYEEWFYVEREFRELLGIPDGKYVDSIEVNDLTIKVVIRDIEQ